MFMNLTIGYAKPSSDDKDMKRQLEVLKGTGCQSVFEDRGGGFNECLKLLSSGDVLIIWRLERIAKNLSGLVKVLCSLQQIGAELYSVTEDFKVSPESYCCTLDVFGVLSEFELQVSKERSRTTLELSRARGRNGGRKPKLSPKEILKINQILRDPNASVSKVAEQYGVSRTTIYKHCGVVQPCRQ
ncbi:recombinase family protein [Rheinheimera sp.]|uniref:recombinase family protein n=1 Tax=Rheinheimera sp. TaxID=1869214 RepID=UPI00307E84B5